MSSSTITHSDSSELVWSPDQQKLAYTSYKGLHAYLSDPNSDEERFVVLAKGKFTGFDWSINGTYLSANRADGKWLLFGFNGLTVQLIHTIDASSIEWVDDDQLLYVPEAGGLVLMYLSMNDHHKIILAG